MATQLQLRRGNTTAQNAFTGAEGEVTMDTTTNQLRVHDGSTQGGHVIGDSATQLNNYMTVANTQALFSGLVANVVSTANLTVEVAGYMTVANTQALHTSVTANLNSYIANTNPRITAETARVTLLNTNLTATNTAIRTLVSDRMQVANTNTLVNDRMQVANTNTLVNDRMQVANTQALHTNVTANLNSYIANTNPRITSLTTNVNDRMQVANTNTLVNDRMQVANTVALANARLGAGATVALTGDVTASATAFSTNAVSVATTIANDSVDGNKLTDNITLAGDLTVGGGDITLSGTGRIQGVDTVSAATDAASKTYVDTAVANIVDSAPAALDTLNELAAALGDDASFSTTVATNIGQKLGATASVTLTGDVTGTASFSANAVSIATTYNNDVVLGTDTSGNYVASLTPGALIDVSGNSGESATPTIDVDLSELTTSTSNGDGDFFAVVDSSNAQKKLTKANINISGFNNDANFSTTTGTVTSVATGGGLTGGTITGSGTISHSDTSSQASVNNSGRTYIQDITLDTYGHVTGIASATETVTNTDTNTNQLTTFQLEDGDGTEVTISHAKEVKFVEAGGININWTDTSTGSDGDPYDLSFSINTGVTAGSGLTGGGTLNATRTISHSDTSSQASVNNSGRTYIQDITLDGFGHVTGIASATETVTNTDTNTTYSAGRGLDLSGTQFLLETDLRDSISHIGYDSGDYIQWSNNAWQRTVVNGSEIARFAAPGTASQMYMNMAGHVQTTTLSGTQTPDMSNYNSFVWTLNGNLTLGNPGDEVAGMSGVFIFIHSGAGRTVSLSSDWETAGGAGLTLSGSSGAVDIVPYFVQSSGNILLGTPQLAFT